LCKPLLAGLDKPTTAALREAKINMSELDNVEVVGGASRIGCVRRHLKTIWGIDTCLTTLAADDIETSLTTLTADESVAHSAALLSVLLSPSFQAKPFEVIEF
jgi:molecular chaperone DnaK (HSP70)